MTATIKGKEYQIEELALNTPKLSDALIEQGFDGKHYQITGARGAVKMGYKVVRTGRFVIAY